MKGMLLVSCFIERGKTTFLLLFPYSKGEKINLTWQLNLYKLSARWNNWKRSNMGTEGRNTKKIKVRLSVEIFTTQGNTSVEILFFEVSMTHSWHWYTKPFVLLLAKIITSVSFQFSFRELRQELDSVYMCREVF